MSPSSWSWYIVKDVFNCASVHILMANGSPSDIVLQFSWCYDSTILRPQKASSLLPNLS